jgi:hypothetical protein
LQAVHFSGNDFTYYDRLVFRDLIRASILAFHDGASTFDPALLRQKSFLHRTLADENIVKTISQGSNGGVE